MSGLFDQLGPRPLADRLRPKGLDEVVGQDHVVGPEGRLTRMLASGQLGSIIFWGPPGCGKTSIARLISEKTNLKFEQISAIFSGVGELKKLFQTAENDRAQGWGTLLFVDEIHRFNRAQQDSFLPVMESGVITLVGATTENPSFELNAALLSRAQVMVLKRLDEPALKTLLTRAKAALGSEGDLFTPEAEDSVIAMADGDGRYLINLVETALAQQPTLPIEMDALPDLLAKRPAIYDKGQDSHYNLISALHKSLRGSDADGALYWFARMLAGGEDPNYIARRITRFAYEDVGLADPQALQVCLNAWSAYERIGSPEAELALANAVIYLATAPKSNAAYVAYKGAMKSAKETGSLSPPMHILNAPTSLMKDLGYGKGYAYDHNAEDGFSGQNYFPDGMAREQFYTPVERGFEREVSKRLEYWQKLRMQRGDPS